MPQDRDILCPWGFFYLMATNPYNDSSINLAHRERYYESAPDYAAVTRSHEYEDGGRSFNRLNSTAPQEWELIYSGLLVQGVTNEALIFDDHYDAKWQDTPFLFIDKFGDSHAVYYKSFERSHEGNKSWIQQRRVVLIEYPGVPVSGLPDETAPTIPAEFSLTGSETLDLDAGWEASTDDESGVGHYEIELVLGE